MMMTIVCAAKAKKSMMQSLSEDVLKNPYVWLFSLSYFFVYVVRQGVTSWFVFYLSVSLAPSLFKPFCLRILCIHGPVCTALWSCESIS